MEAQAREHERLLSEAHGEDALKHAIAAAELYMQAASKSKSREDRRRLSNKITELIALGERLKANAKVASSASRPPVPESTRPLTTAEKSAVLEASRLHGNVFLPWERAPDPQSFRDAGGPIYTDPSPFSLSPEQLAIFAGWRRPTELPGFGDGSGQGDQEQLMTTQAETDLAQDLATDCSVVASLCAAGRHLGSTKGSLLSSLMYPFDDERIRPTVSKNGKYVFRMYFNGSWRSVAIDDRLPASKTDRTLYVVDRRNPRLIWPALVEKAYLKIRGGYDFPGSNSATDLHTLTGWIPEQIFLLSDELELDETWSRIKKGYDDGNAILSLGTGNIPPEEEKALGLVREHGYAVMNLKKEDGSRLLLIKNPWVDSLVWTGLGCSATLKVHTVGASDGAPNQFWMAIEDVLQHFDSLYVNWNPAMFTHRQDHHFKWAMGDKTEELVFTHNPQYSVLSPSGSPVWVLLNRHWQDGELEILRQRKVDKDRSSTSLATVSMQLGFMALALYATSPPGTRVPLPDITRRLHQTTYVDSPNTLLRYTPAPGTPQTLVITQAELPLPSYSFTLSFFSHNPLTITPAPHPLPYNTSVAGSWTRRTAGGSASHPTYYTNPQYALTLTNPSPISLVLSTSAHDLPLHVAVLFTPDGGRVISPSGRDMLCSSAEYARGCASAAHPRLDSGVTYAVVLSTFEPGHLAPYTLRVSAASPLTLRPLPADGAGRLRSSLPPCPPPGRRPGPVRLRARVVPARLTRVSVHVSAAPLGRGARSSASASNGSGSGGGGGGGSAVRVALEVGRGAHRTVLALSREGEFADAAMGLRTAEVRVENGEALAARGGLWVVLEQIGGGAAAYGNGGGGGGGAADGGSGSGSGSGAGGVQVEVLSDGAVEVGGWENADED